MFYYNTPLPNPTMNHSFEKLCKLTLITQTWDLSLENFFVVPHMLQLRSQWAYRPPDQTPNTNCCLPFLEKNSRLYFPAATTLRGTFPRSSMIRAMWSAHHHIHHRGNRHGSALQHAHTRQHKWLPGTDTHRCLGALQGHTRCRRGEFSRTGVVEPVCFSRSNRSCANLGSVCGCVKASVCPSPTSSLASATSSVEEFPGIFSRERKVPRNTAQQLYDVGYVVYRGEREGGREGGGGNRRTPKEEEAKERREESGDVIGREGES